MIANALTLLKIPPVLRLLRVKHWAKNLFLFIPLFFAGQLFNFDAVMILIGGFVAFNLVASAVYILNDFNDIESDRIHPEKCNRPLASGEIGLMLAFSLVAVLLLSGFALAWYVKADFFVILSFYLAINIAYSFGLKQVALLDLFIIALGFLLRVIAGGVLTSVPLSQWLCIMVFLLALFLALAKRRDDVLIFMESGQHTRDSVKHYNLEFLGSCLTLISAIIMMSYIMYTVSPDVKERLGSEYLYITAIFVIAGMMRYLQITMVEKKSGSPTDVLYKDKFIRVTILGWIVTFYVILYLHKL